MRRVGGSMCVQEEAIRDSPQQQSIESAYRKLSKNSSRQQLQMEFLRNVEESSNYTFVNICIITLVPCFPPTTIDRLLLIWGGIIPRSIVYPPIHPSSCCARHDCGLWWTDGWMARGRFECWLLGLQFLFYANALFTVSLSIYSP